MTPAEWSVLADAVAIFAEARAHEAKSKALEATAISSLSIALRSLGATASASMTQTGALLTVQQYAKKRGVSASFLYKMMKEAHFPFVPVTARKRFIDEREAEVWFRSRGLREDAAAAPPEPQERAVRRAALKLVEDRSRRAR